jgi:hypothetical protein
MKIVFYISILMSLGYAQFKLGGVIPFGVGMGISGENKKVLDVDAKIFYYYYENAKTGLGIAWVPVNYLSAGIDMFWTPLVLLVSLFPGSGK